MLRARPGQTGTTYAVIATLSLPALAVPPVIGVAADRFGSGVGLALYALLPVVVLALLLVPSRRAPSLGTGIPGAALRDAPPHT